MPRCSLKGHSGGGGRGSGGGGGSRTDSGDNSGSSDGDDDGDMGGEGDGVGRSWQGKARWYGASGSGRGNCSVVARRHGGHGYQPNARGRCEDAISLHRANIDRDMEMCTRHASGRCSDPARHGIDNDTDTDTGADADTGMDMGKDMDMGMGMHMDMDMDMDNDTRPCSAGLCRQSSPVARLAVLQLADAGCSMGKRVFAMPAGPKTWLPASSKKPR